MVPVEEAQYHNQNESPPLPCTDLADPSVWIENMGSAKTVMNKLEVFQMKCL